MTSLHVACCLLFVVVVFDVGVRCVLFVVCSCLFVVCLCVRLFVCVLLVVCCLLFVVCCLLFVTFVGC